MPEKRKEKDGDAITSQFIFDRVVWRIKSKEREKGEKTKNEN